MANPPRDKGTRWESKVLPVLRRIWPEAERTGSRAYERGDFSRTGDKTIEAKDHKSITLAAFMDQAKKAAVKTGGVPVLIVKRRNKGVEQAYVVMELGDWIRGKGNVIEPGYAQTRVSQCGDCRRKHLPEERCGYDRT